MADSFEVFGGGREKWVSMAENGCCQISGCAHVLGIAEYCRTILVFGEGAGPVQAVRVSCKDIYMAPMVKLRV